MKAIALKSSTSPYEGLLRSALERINQLEVELQQLRNNTQKMKKSIRLHLTNRVITTSPADVLYVRAESNYSRIYLRDGSQYYTSRTLKSWERELSSSDFLRCHRTFLVNREAILEINRNKHELFVMNGISIPTSRRFQKSCLSALFSKSPNPLIHEGATIHRLVSSPMLTNENNC